MSFRSDKLALFIDGANLFATVKVRLASILITSACSGNFRAGGRWSGRTTTPRSSKIRNTRRYGP